jgi:hypothetical protein
VLVALSLAAVACSGSSTPAPPPDGGAASPVTPSVAPTEALGPTDTGTAGASASGGDATGPGDAGGSTGTVEGRIVSSGAYAATWTWQAPNTVDPGEVVLVSDKNTFGDLLVDTDGSITFTIGVPKFADASPFLGDGGTQTVKQVAGSPVVCGIAVDSDVTGSDGTVIHLKGSLSIKGTVTGDVGDITC